MPNVLGSMHVRYRKHCVLIFVHIHTINVNNKPEHGG
jgi:hypothetical protein